MTSKDIKTTSRLNGAIKRHSFMHDGEHIELCEYHGGTRPWDVQIKTEGSPAGAVCKAHGITLYLSVDDNGMWHVFECGKVASANHPVEAVLAWLELCY